MISGTRKTFCDGIVSGLNQTKAYRAAYPKSTAEAARKHAPRLVANGDIRAEIESHVLLEIVHHLGIEDVSSHAN